MISIIAAEIGLTHARLDYNRRQSAFIAALFILRHSLFTQHAA